ncbi:MAG: hypothetical protein LUD51_05715 [Clostridia bacterium]|nr:hypothetical protein [Clostridia bacterium]
MAFDVEEIDPDEDFVDYDYEGAIELAGKLYGDDAFDNDPDYYVHPVLQTLRDTAKRRVSATEVSERLDSYRQVRDGEDDIMAYYIGLFTGFADDAAEAARCMFKKNLYLAFMSFVSGLLYAKVLLDMNPDFAGRYANMPDERYRAENQKAHVDFTLYQARNSDDRFPVKYGYEDFMWECEQHGASEIIFNPGGSGISFKPQEIRAMGARLYEMDRALQTVIKKGIAGDELFPSLMEQYYGKHVECTMTDGSVLSGVAEKVDVPEGDWDSSFYLETESGEELISTGNVKLIKQAKAPKPARKSGKA